MFCTSCGATVGDGTKFCPSCGSALASQGAPAQPPAFAPSPVGLMVPRMDYATWANRLIGYLVDALLVAPVLLILYFLLGGVILAVAGVGGRDTATGMCCFFIVLFPLATLAVGLYNRVYLVASRGYSIGQGLVKIKVVDANGALLTHGTALIRLLVFVAMAFVPFLQVIDLLWPLWDDRRQTLHDKAVNSYVINNPQAA
jgi:uncharacterized RDD family membrane protein YckC